jgi:hypothetical protein
MAYFRQTPSAKLPPEIEVDDFAHVAVDPPPTSFLASYPWGYSHPVTPEKALDFFIDLWIPSVLDSNLKYPPHPGDLGDVIDGRRSASLLDFYFDAYELLGDKAFRHVFSEPEQKPKAWERGPVVGYGGELKPNYPS